MAQNYVLLERIELNNTAASVTFSNIPQTGYTDLKLVYSGRTDRSGSVTSDIYLQFNGVTTATYSFKRIYATGTGTPASDGLTNNSQGGFAGAADGSTATASTFSNAEVYIPNYVGGSAKSWSVDAVTEHNSTGVLTTIQAGLWSGTSAITSITVKDYNAANWVAGSTFSLYGIAAVGTTPVVAPKADGGNVIATDGTYWYHAFLSNGTFTPQVGLSADVLVVAGGGGGANNIGGGGAAGGLRVLSSQSLASGTSYVCTIGSGGAGAYTPGGTQTLGTKGVNSSFSSISATGGGYGANGDNNGGTGGSGGGTRASVANGGSGNEGGYSPVEGYSGGKGSASTNSGGGGGAAEAGVNGTSGQSGRGGNGTNAYSSWATATGTGASGYYAGGGGGGGYDTGSVAAGAGGSGGGGAGSYVTASNGNNGTINTGGGGGGAAAVSGPAQSAGAGGSGIVIVRYTVA